MKKQSHGSSRPRLHGTQSRGIRVKMDDRDNVSTGFKFNDWEMRGVPVRVEIGPKDVEKGSVALARRDKPGREGKSFVPQTDLALDGERSARRNPGCASNALSNVRLLGSGKYNIDNPHALKIFLLYGKFKHREKMMQ